ncbi:MAG: hypothetical protein ACXVQQ_06750 [Gaiellaceae bacterium]
MLDIEVRRMMMEDRIGTLRRAARSSTIATRTAAAAETGDVELRLCKASDDDALGRLAALSEQPVPFGRLVVALVDGTLVAAVPLAGGCALRDPFVRTAHLVRLLELRAAQLRQPEPRVAVVPRFLRRHA